MAPDAPRAIGQGRATPQASEILGFPPHRFARRMGGDAAVFFLRCMFWLAIVYASMSWTREDLAPGRWVRVPSVPGSLATVVGDKAATGAAMCKADPAGCLTQAARLTALIEGTGDADADLSPKAVAHAAGAPRNPRRHGAAPGQTPAR